MVASRVVITVGLFVALSVGASARAEDNAGKRKKAIADAKAQVKALKAFLAGLDKAPPCPDGYIKVMTPLPTSDPAGAPSAPLPKGKAFCPADSVPTEKKIDDNVEVADANNLTSGDNEAGALKSYWHQWVQTYQSRLVDLDKMKALVTSADVVLKECKDDKDDLMKKAKAAAARKSLDDFYDVRLQAEKYETTIDSIISTEQQRESEIKSLLNMITTFHPDGEYDAAWKPIYTELHSQANKVAKQWTDKWAKSYKECGPLAEGEENPEVHAKEDEMYLQMKKDLDDELNKWKEDAKAVYKIDCDSMKKLYENYCTNWDGDRENANEEPLYKSEAEKLQTQIKDKLTAPEAALDSMATRAMQLSAARNGRMPSIDAYKAWVKTMDDFAALIKAERDALDRIKYNGIFKGYQNPKIQLWMSYGVQRHDEMYKTFKCTLADEAYCLSSNVDTQACRIKRPDCVLVDDCEIREFKPKGKAVEAGKKQLQGYKTMLEDYYGYYLDRKADKESYADAVGGAAVVDTLAAKCVTGGKLTFKTPDVDTYEPCTSPDTQYTCGQPGAATTPPVATTTPPPATTPPAATPPATPPTTPSTTTTSSTTPTTTPPKPPRTSTQKPMPAKLKIPTKVAPKTK